MASVGHLQRRSVPRRDLSAERYECRKISQNRRENVPVLEKWSHGHMAAVTSASPKAVMMASMLRLVVLVDGWR